MFYNFHLLTKKVCLWNQIRDQGVIQWMFMGKHPTAWAGWDCSEEQWPRFCSINRVQDTGLACSGARFTSWGEGASLALVCHLSSDDITIKIPYGVDVLLHQLASHSIFSYWVG